MQPMDRETRAQRIGPYVSPEGYYELSKAMPFLGRVKCRTEQIEVGSWQEIVLDYEVGASGLADGAWIKATFKFYSDWALFQTVDPQGANYVSAEYQAGPLLPGQEPATVQALGCRFDQKGHERPFQKAIIVDVSTGISIRATTSSSGWAIAAQAVPAPGCRASSRRISASAFISTRSAPRALPPCQVTW